MTPGIMDSLCETAARAKLEWWRFEGELKAEMKKSHGGNHG